MREVGPDVVTNLTPKEGRLVVILLDYSIRNADIPWARRTAHVAVDQLAPGDMAAVVYTSVGVPQNFTADRSLLRAAIDRPFLGIDVDPDDPFGARRGECRCGVCSLEVMTNVADAVREVAHRRKGRMANLIRQNDLAFFPGETGGCAHQEHQRAMGADSRYLQRDGLLLRPRLCALLER